MKRFFKSPKEAIQLLKYRQYLAIKRAAFTNGSVLLSQTKQISKPSELLAAKSEIMRLRAQLHCTEEERDILKKSARYFAKELE